MTDILIFDIDGTLIDSVDLHARAWQEAFEHFGHQISFEDIRSQIGKGGDQLLPVFLDPGELKKQGKKLEEYRSKLFKENYLKDVKPFPGVRALFEKAKTHKQRLAVASSAKEDELKTYERIAQIDDLIDVEASSADAEKSKPHPDIFEAALTRLGPSVKRDTVLVIGDSPYDVEAAHKAGLKAVCVRCGGFAEQDLREAGCAKIYDDPEDLLRNYETSPLAPQS